MSCDQVHSCPCRLSGKVDLAVAPTDIVQMHFVHKHVIGTLQPLSAAIRTTRQLDKLLSPREPWQLPSAHLGTLPAGQMGNTMHLLGHIDVHDITPEKARYTHTARCRKLREDDRKR